MAIRDTSKDRSELRKARAGLALSMVPKIPELLRVLARRMLGLSEKADYLDLETDMVLTILRSTLCTTRPRSIAKAQAMTLLDPGVKGRVWIVDAVAEVPPERGVQEALMQVILAMMGEDQSDSSFPEARAHRKKGSRGSNSSSNSDRNSNSNSNSNGNGSSSSSSGGGRRRLRMPPMRPVEAEWTGYRAGVSRNARPPTGMSDAEKYVAMMRECRGGSGAAGGGATTTVLYFHGGAYYLCDPSTHRRLTKRLARAVGGRVYSVRYRLAPQNPFPAALLDALVSYLTLLYPPPGSLHEAVSPKDIVFGGDRYVFLLFWFLPFFFFFLIKTEMNALFMYFLFMVIIHLLI